MDSADSAVPTVLMGDFGSTANAEFFLPVPPSLLDKVFLEGKSLRWWQEHGLGNILRQMLEHEAAVAAQPQREEGESDE